MTSHLHASSIDQFIKIHSTTMKFIISFYILVWINLSYGYTSFKPEQIHLSMGDNPREMVVTWSTRNLTDGQIQYGRTSMAQKLTAQRTTFGGLIQNLQYIHRVKMVNLQPDASYMYRVGSTQGGWSPVYHFKTLKEGTDWSPNILIYGDLGLENNVAVPFIQHEVQSGAHDLLFHIGDIGYDMYEQGGTNGDNFMREMEPIAANIPYMTCVGNHEWHYNFTNYKNRFTMPGGDGEGFFYSFDVGPVHFIAISTEFYYYVFYGINQLARQYKWLENDLKEANKPENRAQRPWIVTFGHRPMYCSNGADHDCYQYESIIRNGLPVVRWYGLEKLWAKYGVDLAFWAHEHSYERLWPIYDRKVRNGSTSEPYTDPRAPVHITSGSAGCRENLDPFKAPKPAWSAVRIGDYGYTKLKIHNSTHLNVKQISAVKKGLVVDEISLVKHHHGPYEPFA